MAKRTQYYCPFLTPSALPPLLSRELRGCEPGATVERSETGERAMFAPAGQTTARACLRSKLAALVVRRQAPPNPRRGEQQRCRGGIYAARNLPRQPVNGKGAGLPPSLAPLVRDPFTAVCRGRACPALHLAITTPFILCIVGRGHDPSAGRRGRRPLQHNPQGFSLTQTSAAAWGQAALHPTLPYSVGRAFACNSFTPPRRGRACPARSLAITTPVSFAS